MTKSDAINELVTALAKAQREMKGAIKDVENPYFKKNYADLSSIWEACREPLSKNLLSVIQTTNITDKGLVLTTILAHSSGQWISGEYPIKPAKEDPQGYGSAMSYARRYALAAMVGVVQIDDDGESAMPPRNDYQKTTPSVHPKPIISVEWKPGDKEKNEIIAMTKIPSTTWTTDGIGKYIKLRYKKDKLIDLNRPQYDELISIIKTKKMEDAFLAESISEDLESFGDAKE